jgi:hypothetical protein
MLAAIGAFTVTRRTALCTRYVATETVKTYHTLYTSPAQTNMNQVTQQGGKKKVKLSLCLIK